MNATLFHSEVSCLLSTAAHASAEERRLKANALIEAYVAGGGDLDAVSTDLDRLANYVLADELSDRRKDVRDVALYTDEQMRKKDRRHGTPVSLSEIDPAGNIRHGTLDRIQVEEEIERHQKAKRQRQGRVNAEQRRNDTDMRIRQALDANPGASVSEISRIAHVTRPTVYRYLRTQKV